MECLSPAWRRWQQEANQMDDLLDRDGVCRFFGGAKPIDPSTLYRNIKAGRGRPRL